MTEFDNMDNDGLTCQCTCCCIKNHSFCITMAIVYYFMILIFAGFTFIIFKHRHSLVYHLLSSKNYKLIILLAIDDLFIVVAALYFTVTFFCASIKDILP